MTLYIRNVPSELHKSIKVASAQAGLTLGEFVVWCVKMKLDNVPRETSGEKLSTSDLVEKAGEAFKAEMGREAESPEELSRFLKETV